MTDVGRMSKREARQAVRAHWIEFILNADVPDDYAGNDDTVAAIWSDECQRIATRIERATSQKDRP